MIKIIKRGNFEANYRERNENMMGHPLGIIYSDPAELPRAKRKRSVRRP